GPGGMVGINAKSIVEISTKGSEEVLKLGIKLVDQAGTQHQIDQILQHRTEPDNLLNLARNKNLSPAARKRILQNASAGPAALHDQGILHSGKLIIEL
ncbi:hypothetical protein GX50_07119, partial [[Emmonsia] crescens]